MGRHSDRVATGDTYDDLIEAIERGMVADEPGLVVAELRHCYTIELGAWVTMLADLLGQIAADAGSRTRGLDRLRVPPTLRDAWRRDLAEAVGSVAVASDGALDPARLRPRYTIERAPWLRMVGDLLGQVVGDAGSVGRASTVLAVPLDSLLAWVRWFVSRGSIDAACSRWPVAPVGDTTELAAYDDLAEAVERGAVDGDNAIDPPSVRDVYAVRLDSWERMSADLLGQIIADAGSVRAAESIGPAELAIVLLMGDCGLRTGEVIALEWTHVRWTPEAQLVVQRSHWRGHFGSPKSGRPRTVPMTDRVVTVLRALPRSISEPWVIIRESKHGRGHETHSSLAWAVGRVERVAGFGKPNARGKLHRLRHCFVTRLAAAGVAPRSIMELAGHTRLETTMRYMHLLPGAGGQAIAALETFDNQGRIGAGHNGRSRKSAS